MQITNTKNKASGLSGPDSLRSKRNGLLSIALFIAVLAAFTALIAPAFAADELRLIGIVKTIDPRSGIVFVDVQSESCPGIRRFYADDLGVLGRYVNKTITFYIDSAICRDTSIHTIRVSWGIK